MVEICVNSSGDINTSVIVNISFFNSQAQSKLRQLLHLGFLALLHCYYVLDEISLLQSGFTFSSGNERLCIEARGINDSVVEEDETVIVHLTSSQEGVVFTTKYNSIFLLDSDGR